jgi:hypothetical protein
MDVFCMESAPRLYNSEWWKGSEWSAWRPVCFTPGERGPGTHWIGGRVGPRAGLNDVEKKKFLSLPRLDPSVVQPVASRYTDYAIPAHNIT